MSAVDLELTLRAAGSHYAVTLHCIPMARSAPIDTSATPVLIAIDQACLRALTPDPAAYGLALGQMLLTDPLLARMVAQAHAVARQRDVPLRVRLTFSPDAAELHALRWETLRDPTSPNMPVLTIGTQIYFSRYLSSADWQPVSLQPDRPRRALVVLACPSDLADYHLAPFDVAAERLLIEHSLGTLSCTVLAQGHATLTALTEHLRGGYDILYILAHGRADAAGETWLYLEGEGGLTDAVRGSELATRIAELRVRPPLILLASCESAGDGHGPALLALGARLAEVGIGAVLAMQSRITMETLRQFLPACLRAFQTDGQIDAAVAVARGVVRDRSDFWVPALFLRLPSGRLWSTSIETETDLRRQIEERLNTTRAALRVLLAQAWATEASALLPPQLRASVTQLQQRIMDDKASLRSVGSLVTDAPEDSTVLPLAPATATSLAPYRQQPMRKTVNEDLSEGGATDLYAQYRAYLLRMLPPLDAPAQPYLGLQTFQFEHADRFFGRDRLVAELAERLGQAPFLAVLGASGSGKSSVVRAGLLPLLKAGGLPGSEQWQYLTLRPGAQPLDALVAALSAARGSSMTEALDLAAQLAANTRALLLIARLFPSRLVLVVDQAEELWTLQPADPEQRVLWQEQQQRPFLRLLLSALSVPDRPILVILVLRTDFLHRASDDAAFASAIADHDVIVSPMTGEELQAAIELPAQQAGGMFEPGLVDELIAQTEGQSGALPLLEYTLQELWVQRQSNGVMTWASYRALGGVEGALAKRADSLLQQHAALVQHDEIRRVLLRLIQPGEGAVDTRRRVALADLAAGDQSPDAVYRLLQPLIDARLLTTGQEQGRSATIEVSHEALIRSWPTLRAWIDEARSDLRLQIQLEEAAKEWQASGRDGSLLWNGLKLSNVEAWVQRAQPHLSARDAVFLEASRTEAQHQLEAAAQVERDRRRLAEEQGNARRLRTFLLATGSLLIVAIIATTAALISQGQTEQARISADIARATAVRAQVTTAQFADVQRLIAASQSHYTDDPQVSLLLANEVVQRTAHFPAADRQHHLLGLDTLMQGLSRTSGIALGSQAGPVSALAFSPDGHRLASAGEDGTVRLWHMSNTPLAMLTLKGHTQAITALAFSPNGHTLASASADGTIRVWNVEKPTEPAAVLRGHVQAIHSLAFSPDGRTIATGGADMTVRLWSIENTHAQPVVLRGHTDEVVAVTFSPDGRTLATGSADGTARLWSMTTPTQPSVVLRGHTASVLSLAFSPDGHMLATGSEDATICLWSMHSFGQPLAILKGHIYGISKLVFSPDGQTLASASQDSDIRLWHTTDPAAPPTVLKGNQEGVLDLAFSPNGRSLASARADGIIGLWSLDSPHPSEHTLLGHEGRVAALAFSPNGALLATAGADGFVRLWPLDTSASFPVTLTGHTRAIYALAFSPDGHLLATISADTTLRLWDLTQLHTTPIILRGHEDEIYGLAFSPDGRSIATASRDRTTRVWRTDAPDTPPIVLRGHTDAVNTVGFSPDGHTLVTVSQDNTIRIWDLSTPDAAKFVLRGHTNNVVSLAISPDGHTLITGSIDGTVRLWNLDKPTEQATVLTVGVISQTPSVFDGQENVAMLHLSPDGHTLAVGGFNGTVWLWNTQKLTAPPVSFRAHTSTVFSLNISHDGHWLATGSTDGTIRLWRLDDLTATPITLRSFGRVVYAAVFSPDDRWIVTGSDDGAVRIWPIRPAELTDLACVTVGRNLTLGEWHQYIGADEPYRKLCPNLPRHASVYADLLAHSQFGVALLAYQEERSFDPTLDPDISWLVDQAAMLSQEHPRQAMLVYLLARWRDPEIQNANPRALAKLCQSGSDHLPTPVLLDACDRSLANDPDDIAVIYARGRFRAGLGDTVGALADLKSAQRLAQEYQQEDILKEVQRWMDDLQVDRS
jgi:WD40 repeat protein